MSSPIWKREREREEKTLAYEQARGNSVKENPVCGFIGAWFGIFGVFGFGSQMKIRFRKGSKLKKILLSQFLAEQLF